MGMDEISPKDDIKPNAWFYLDEMNADKLLI